MPSKSVMVICSELSHSQMYVIDLINLLLQMGKQIHVVEQCRIGCDPAESNATPSTNNILAPSKHLTLHHLSGPEQTCLNQLIKKQGCRTVFFVCKDGENKLCIESQIPVLSVFVLQLNYENISRRTRDMIKFFNILVGTGHNSFSKLQALKLNKPVRMILPKLLKRHYKETNTNSAKAALGINPNRFVFFMDMNETPEIKCADTVIQAYAQCQKMVPGFKEKAMLLINAAPTIQLVNILKLELFTPDEVSVHIQYYSNGMDKNEVLLNHLIASADVVINVAGGIDFDTHLFLSQEYQKLVIFKDSTVVRRYCIHGIPIKQEQIYFDGLTQGILHLPCVANLKQAMQLVLERFHKFAISETTVTRIEVLRSMYDQFERDWRRYISLMGCV